MRPRTFRRTALRSAAVAFVLAIAGCASTGKQHHVARPAAPPLQHIADGRVVASKLWGFVSISRAGDVVSIGVGSFHNLSKSPVEVIDVAPAHSEGDLTIIGVEAVGPDRTVGVGGASFDTYPPADPELGKLFPAQGFTIPGGESQADLGYGFVVGFRVGSAAISKVVGIDITYRTGGTTYTYSEPEYLTVCEAPITRSDCSTS